MAVLDSTASLSQLHTANRKQAIKKAKLPWQEAHLSHLLSSRGWESAGAVGGVWE
jgi:hypothetical protein